MQVLIIIAVIAAIAAIAYFAWKAEQKRQAAFREWAAQHGWRYSPQRDRGIRDRFSFLDRLRQGSNRYAFHVLRGEWKGFEAVAFSYHYETYSTDSKGNRQTHHHHFGVATIRIEKSFSEVRIHPESFFHRIGQALGVQDIDFESIEFSKAFVVKAEDKKLAYDFCHTGMMEYLLERRSTALELDGEWLAVYDRHKLEPHEIESYLDALVETRALMPGYLFRD